MKKERTKEDIRKEYAEVQNQMMKLSNKKSFTENEEKLWKKLFDKQLTLGKELYKDVKEQRLR